MDEKLSDAKLYQYAFDHGWLPLSLTDRIIALLEFAEGVPLSQLKTGLTLKQLLEDREKWFLNHAPQQENW